VANETRDDWTHDALSGDYDKETNYLYGRGSNDIKNTLIALLETVTLLLEAEWVPRRTIILAFNFDEEILGWRGARTMSKEIQNRYGQKPEQGVAVIIDECAGYEKVWGRVFAKPGVREKGYLTAAIQVRRPGGHASIPPDHTGIGVLSQIVAGIEADRYPAFLDSGNPYLQQLYCGAVHSHLPESDKDHFPSNWTALLEERLANNNSQPEPDTLAQDAATKGPQIQYLMQTSQSVDMVAGGVAPNAIPEFVEIIINQRINIGQTVQDVKDHLYQVAKAVAASPQFSSMGMSVEDWRNEDETLGLHPNTTISPNSIALVAKYPFYDPSPLSPTDASVLTPFAVLAGTTRALYQNDTDEDIIVSPGIATGNTDTQWYWNVTEHIFRFVPGYDPNDDKMKDGIHTVNEKVSMLDHINTIRWYFMFIRNMDEVFLPGVDYEREK